MKDDILIVDDETTNLRLLTELLEKEGYQVRPAQKAQTAIESALAKPPGLMLLDVRMPEIDGFEVCRRLRQDEGTQHVPIIFVSALQDVEARAQGFQAGGVDFITKPFQELEILARVKTHMRLHRMQQNLEQLVDERTFKLKESRASLEQKVRELKEAELASRMSEAQLRAFIDNTDDMICGRDMEGALVFWNDSFNKACTNVLGTESHVGLKTGDLVPPEQREKLEPVYNKFARVFTGENIHVEYTYTWPNGEEHFYEATGSPLRLGDDIVGIAEITRDVTSRKLSEKRLVESWEFNRAILMSMKDHIAVLDKTGIILSANQSWLEFARENDVSLLDLVREGTSYLDVCQRAANDADGIAQEALRGIKAVQDGSQKHFELEYPCHSPLKQRWFLMQVTPFKGEKGGVIVAHTDISARKVAEKELKRAYIMLEDAHRIARMGSWDWDILTNEFKWSDELLRIFGLSTQTFGASYEDFLERVHPDDRESVRAAVNGSLSDPASDYNVMHRIITSDGIERIVRELGKVTFNERGKASRMIVTVQDITDIRRAQIEAERLRAELSQTDRASMMGVLTAGIAHEINQPLTAILSNAQAALRIMKNDSPDFEEVKEILHDIISDDKRAGQIVQSIRNIMGKYELKREAVDLNETIREVVNLVKSEALSRKVLISENLQPDIPSVYVDRTQIQQVTLNLLTNALEALNGHHTSHPEVIVTTRFRDKEAVILSVSDSGPGIEPEHLSKIFDPFETAKKEGMGIGLSTCRFIAEHNGGRIWVENRPEGGAVFFFALPTGVN